MNKTEITRFMSENSLRQLTFVQKYYTCVNRQDVEFKGQVYRNCQVFEIYTRVNFESFDGTNRTEFIQYGYVNLKGEIMNVRGYIQSGFDDSEPHNVYAWFVE